jgi:hypothetical protein
VHWRARGHGRPRAGVDPPRIEGLVAAEEIEEVGDPLVLKGTSVR